MYNGNNNKVDIIYTFQSITEVLEDIVFHQGRFTNVSYDQNIYNCAMLTLGSVAHKLFKKGLTKKSIEITGKINRMLGMHGR